MFTEANTALDFILAGKGRFTLTRPESIDSGFGPECITKLV
jgi:hypothetical protein